MVILSQFSILFDPHSRDDKCAIVLDGTSVILKFSKILELECYIFETYFPFRHSDTLFCQIQYVSIEKPNDITSRAACNIVKKTVTMPQKKLLRERSIKRAWKATYQF